LEEQQRLHKVCSIKELTLHCFFDWALPLCCAGLCWAVLGCAGSVARIV
jgi:hypothetical protein